jgi:hypothetical protein
MENLKQPSRLVYVQSMCRLALHLRKFDRFGRVTATKPFNGDGVLKDGG